nr:MAG TPA: hypothetical protein [Caudoviricetes sp.]
MKDEIGTQCAQKQQRGCKTQNGYITHRDQ